MSKSMRPVQAADKVPVRVIEHTDERRAMCIYATCGWQGTDTRYPEIDAHDHAATHPGHTAIIEGKTWTEYTSDLVVG